MPLEVTADSPTTLSETLTSTATVTKPSFLIVYASLTNGVSWCGDCRRAESFINAKFSGEEKGALVVHAGQRDEWRKQDNPWRQEPFSVTNLPTLIKVTADGNWEKLVEADVYDQKKLDAFVGF